jgi:hypothetical protein
MNLNFLGEFGEPLQNGGNCRPEYGIRQVILSPMISVVGGT